MIQRITSKDGKRQGVLLGVQTHMDDSGFLFANVRWDDGKRASWVEFRSIIVPDMSK